MTYADLVSGCRAYHQNESRDSIYVVSRRLIKPSWDVTPDLVDALAVLLLNWNQAFYRYGAPDWLALERTIDSNRRVLKSLRKRTIFTFNEKVDSENLTLLFNEFLEALKNSKGRTPVGTVKALHLLVPDFFPLWDGEIARAYKCKWAKPSESVRDYLRFMSRTKDILLGLASAFGIKEGDPTDAFSRMCEPCPVARTWNTPLKMLDEFNYAKYSKKWL
jgi:hypothetical protein